jgi:iron-regulated transporter 1
MPADSSSPASPWPPETYASHALARWAWRQHEFLVALLLVEINGSSFRAVAVYGACDNVARLVFTPAAGAWLDRCPSRVSGVATMLLLQNASIMTSAVAAALALGRSTSSAPSLLAAAVIVAGGSLCGVGSAGAALGVEREWPSAVAKAAAAQAPTTEHRLLSEINSRMRAIDLACQLLAPACAGVLMSTFGGRAAALASAAFCALAWAPQVLLLRAAVGRSAALSAPPKAAAAGGGGGGPEAQAAAAAQPSSAIAAYLRQGPLAAPGLALALLYCTVLSLGMLMTAFLKSRGGLSEAAIAGGRGLGALSGVGAALLFPRVAAALGGVPAAGLGGIAWQLSALVGGTVPAVVAALSFSAAGGAADASPSPVLLSRGAVWLLIAGLVLSRAGLWTFDLAVTQLQQERVAAQDQAKVGGAQAGLQAGFELLSFVVCFLLFPKPEQFASLMGGSLLVVASAAGLYAWWWWRWGGGRQQEQQQGGHADGGGGGSSAAIAVEMGQVASEGGGEEEAAALLLRPPS